MATTVVTRVLVVEDNNDVGEALAEAIELMGYEVRLVQSSEQAMPAVESFEPSIAVLDIGLPKMDGYALAEKLKRSGLRMVALTGYGRDSDRKRSMQAGFDSYLLKPIDFDTLNRALVALVPPR